MADRTLIHVQPEMNCPENNEMKGEPISIYQIVIPCSFNLTINPSGSKADLSDGSAASILGLFLSNTDMCDLYSVALYEMWNTSMYLQQKTFSLGLCVFKRQNRAFKYRFVSQPKLISRNCALIMIQDVFHMFPFLKEFIPNCRNANLKMLPEK